MLIQLNQTISICLCYNVNFSLNVYTANSDDGLQIIEQILPFFQPDYTVTMMKIEQWIQKEIYHLF